MSQRLDPGDEPGLPGALGAIFAEPVDPLASPAGRFEEICAAVRRRRHRRRAAVALSAAAVAVVLAVGVSAVAGLVGTSTTTPVAGRIHGGERSLASAPVVATVPAGRLPSGDPVPAGFLPRSVSTASNDVVYALGDAPCAQRRCPLLLRTSDDGQSWRGLRPPAGVVVDDVRFANPRDGWLFSPQLWVTHDGSAGTGSWRHVDVGGTVVDLATDGATVWVFVADCTAGGTDAGCRAGRLLASPVGADSFAPVATVSVSGPFVDAELRVAGPRGTLVVAGGPGAGVVFVRGGSGWIQLPQGRPCQQAPVAVLPPATGPAALVALCAADAGAGSVTYVPHRSTDGGRTWVRTGPGLRVANGVHSVAADSLDRLVVTVGSPDLRGGLWVSRDGGQTWSVPPSLPRTRTGWAWVGAAGGARYLALPFEPTGSVWTSATAGRGWVEWALR